MVGSVQQGNLPPGVAWPASASVACHVMDRRVGRFRVWGVDLASRLLLYLPLALLATIVVELNKRKGGEETRKEVESAAEGGLIGRCHHC